MTTVSTAALQACKRNNHGKGTGGRGGGGGGGPHATAGKERGFSPRNAQGAAHPRRPCFVSLAPAKAPP
eukprot:5982586-Pyramimonas_sp.AAC.1